MVPPFFKLSYYFTPFLRQMQELFVNSFPHSPFFCNNTSGVLDIFGKKISKKVLTKQNSCDIIVERSAKTALPSTNTAE
jgi:hypothetical protein